MLISESKKILFIQIPGTKCEPLTKIIAPYVLECHKNEEFTRINNRYARFASSLPIMKRAGLKPEEYFKVVLVRNPYHRLIDIWQNHYKSPKDSIDSTFINNLRFAFARHTGLSPFPAQEFHQMYPEGDFKSFILFLEYILTKFRLDIAREYIGAGDQYSYIENDRWTEFDYIASYETLNLDIANLNHKFDLKGIELPLNRDKEHLDRKQFVEAYDEETLKITNRLFIRDFVYFGYEKMSWFEFNQVRESPIAV